MARSVYIYVVKNLNKPGEQIEAICTVKREAFIWIRKNRLPLFEYAVYRTHDGSDYYPIEVYE